MPSEPTTTKPRKAVWPVIVASLLAATVSGGSTYVLATQPTPLGVPIPPAPTPMFTVTNGATPESSYLKRSLPKGWLARLAPQPDGTPYMYNSVVSEKLQYRIRFPYGSENLQFGEETFAKDRVDMEARVGIDQPLAAIKVTLFPRDPAESQQQFAERLLAEQAKAGAVQVDKPHSVQLPGGGFVTLAFRKKTEDGDLIHRLYCAGVSDKRVLVFDLIERLEYAVDAEKYVDKIMRSFEPGPLLGPRLEVKAPAKPEAKQPEAGAS